MLEIPIPSAMSRIDRTSSESKPPDRGRPRITAPGDASRRSLHPSKPPSRKSTKDSDPLAAESAENRDIDPLIISGGASRRYLCLSPFGGATSSSSPMPFGTRNP